MKITLHKPRRKVANAVLAYDYEPADEIGYTDDIWHSYWTTDAFCHEGEDCWHKHGAGDCFLMSNGTDQVC